jgi:carbamoyl-phosphate synthase large subunit
VLLLGSGALKIGEAGEFDYSGSQALKALKDEGVAVVLVNPNIATVQTGPELADRVYFLPVDPSFVRRVIEREWPEGILLSFGGQTALNCGLALWRDGTLDTYGVRVLGTPPQTIEATEDRDLFVRRLAEIGVRTPRSQAVTTVANAVRVGRTIGFPVILRAAFALGGEGSGVAYSADELRELAQRALARAPQVLIEEYLAGWKEIEYEVVRDGMDNCITVCNMENFDPMGVHTGESIVVAPSQTLTNDEYHLLRSVAIKVIRHLGVVGECNIQFALDPRGSGYRVIEVNARLSRSSALASKATGYPLATIAAKLALGYTLPELPNAVTGQTSACFEPALDYVVVKYPRWDLDKFRRVDTTLGSSMKSVGEVMAIARTFEAALQKAVRMLGYGYDGLGTPADAQADEQLPDEQTDEEALARPTPERLFNIAAALRRGTTPARIAELTGIDRWFIERMADVVACERELAGRPDGALDAAALRRYKAAGFSDRRLATLLRRTESDVRAQRRRDGILPVTKSIDTLAAEYPAQTNYLYMTYGDRYSDVEPAATTDPKKIMILGSGPYRIGSSVEFDWCTVTAATTLRARGYTVIMVNNNPETVSTDYDVCDKLYFEELSLERVRDIYEIERPAWVILSMGGQTPNTLALALHAEGIPVLGTSPISIDRAEDRHKFSALLDELGIDQPPWAELSTLEQAEGFAERVGYPVLVRPSYVLSGSAMNVAYNRAQLHEYLRLARVSSDHPIVISKFMQGAKEIEIDAVAQGGKLIIYALSEHVENAGVHSGDSTVMVPPQRLYLDTIRQVKRIAKRLAAALDITGPFNIQLLAQEGRVQVIELNLRASRSFPFVSKVTGYNFVELAVRAMLGEDVSGTYQTVDLDYVGVKAPQFSFSRLKGADPILRVEMASTGEVATFGRDLHEAYLKSVLAVGMKLPRLSVFVSLGGPDNKLRFLESARRLHALGLQLYCTRLTSAFLTAHDVPNTRIYKVHEKGTPSIVDYLRERRIDLLINVTDEYVSEQFEDDYIIRRAAVDYNVPLLTNLQAARLFVAALARYRLEDLSAAPWDEYVTMKKVGTRVAGAKV